MLTVPRTFANAAATDPNANFAAADARTFAITCGFYKRILQTA